MSTTPTPRKAPRITVSMPLYNTERYVAEAIESVLDQTYDDFELLIADGGSTDRSLDIVAKYAAQDPRIRYWQQPDTNSTWRINQILDQARGEFFAQMHTDDVSLPQRFARQVEFLDANPDHAVVGGRILIIDPDGDPLAVWCHDQTHEEIDDQLINRTGLTTVIGHPLVMCRRQALLEVGKYNPAYPLADDLDLWLRLAEHGWKLANPPEILLKYRLHFKSVCHSNPDASRIMANGIVAEARRRRGLSEIPARPESRPDLDDSRPLAHRFRWGWWALTAGYIPSARKHAKYCLTHAPLSKESWRLAYCSWRGR